MLNTHAMEIMCLKHVPLFCIKKKTQLLSVMGGSVHYIYKTTWTRWKAKLHREYQHILTETLRCIWMEVAIIMLTQYHSLWVKNKKTDWVCLQYLLQSKVCFFTKNNLWCWWFCCCFSQEIAPNDNCFWPYCRLHCIQYRIQVSVHTDHGARIHTVSVSVDRFK